MATPVQLNNPFVRNSMLACLVMLAAATITCAGQLPDTGQTSCYNMTAATDCVADTGFPRQDGSQVAAAGYTKLDAAGNDLDASAPSWSCVRDNATGLVWEVKTSDSGLRDAAHRYVWLSFDVGNGGVSGGAILADFCGGTIGTDCNTENYVSFVNGSNYCGANDWRLPTQMELLTLVHAGNIRPAIDAGFFPNTASVPYWSSLTYAVNPLNAWGVHFGYGATHAVPKSEPNAVRLVRGVWGQQP